MKILEMSFSTQGEKAIIIRLPNPRDDLKRSDVESTMQNLIDNNILKDKNLSANGIKSISILTTEKTEL